MRKFRTFVVYLEPDHTDPAFLIPLKELRMDGMAVEYTGFDELKNLIDEIEPQVGFRHNPHGELGQLVDDIDYARYRSGEDSKSK